MQKNQNQNQQQTALTSESVWAMIYETNKQIKENGKQIRENGKLMNKYFKEDRAKAKEERAKFDKLEKSIKESRKEYEEQLKEEKERGKVIDARLDRLGKYIGGIAHSNGDMAEEFFYNTLRKDKTFLNEKFDSIRKNLTYRGLDNELDIESDAEYDILLFNGTSAALIEVKYNAKQDNIDVSRLLRRAEIFKLQFPEYKNHKLYLGVAALSFNRWVAKRLHRAGIATIRQVGRKMVVYDKEVKQF